MSLPNIPIRYISRFLIGYMILAFGWWAVHVWTENRELFEAEKALLISQYAGRGVNLTQLEQTAEFQAIQRRCNKRRRMVIAEGCFFIGCLAAGLWIINRSANREVSLARQRRNFLLSITHELKSPIAALRLTLETLTKRELSREQLDKLYSNGLRDAARLQNLVEDLLLAARLEDNWRPLQEPLDLGLIARDVVARLLVRFPKANIRIALPDNLPPVQADKPGLTAVVQNLLENAVKYAPEGSEVLLEGEKTPEGKLKLRVADQGQGIPDAEKKAVFEKFYRIGNEETRQATGTGLGLYIVQQVLKAHGGSIQVSDNHPRGTVFSIEL